MKKNFFVLLIFISSFFGVIFAILMFFKNLKHDEDYLKDGCFDEDDQHEDDEKEIVYEETKEWESNNF